MKNNFDFLVIGGGSGGVRASRMAASMGAKVTLFEKSKLGGTCVNLGCVPKKLLVYASDFRQQFQVARGYGWEIKTNFNWQQLISNKNKEIERLNSIYKKLLLDSNVTTIFGEAEVIDKNTIKVADTVYHADKLLLATGGIPVLPNIIGIENANISDDMFFLKKLPKKVVVVGAGYIAIEFAGIFHSLGVETTIVHRNQSLLRGFDRESVNHLIDSMKKNGVNFELDTQIEKITSIDTQKEILLDNGKQLKVNLILCAIGRLPNFNGINPSKLGIKIASNGGIEVNNVYQTSIPNIYAVGDLINHVNLTPVAIKQAMVVVNHLFGNKTKPLNYTNLPTAIFSQPNLATVGLSEEEAGQKYSIEVFKSSPTPMKYSLSTKKEKSLLKLIINKKNQRIIGAQMVGPDAGEIIQIIAVAIHAKVTKVDFDKTIGVHPSLAEEWVTLK